MNKQQLITQLRIDEGIRHKPYKDSVGKLTIGVGRNLDDVGLSDDEINYLLSNDIDRTYKQLQTYSWFTGLDDIRQTAITNMAFNLGITRLLGFTQLIAHLTNHEWQQAHDAMLKSKWATQVGLRAVRLAQVIATGQF